MDIAEELPKLKSNLAMTSSKIDRWLGEEKQSILREMQAQIQSNEDARRGTHYVCLRVCVCVCVCVCVHTCTCVHAWTGVHF